MCLGIGFDFQADAAVTSAAVTGAYSVRCFEVWPFSCGLMTALDTDGPVTVSVIEPGVAGRGVVEPAAARDSLVSGFRRVRLAGSNCNHGCQEEHWRRHPVTKGNDCVDGFHGKATAGLRLIVAFSRMALSFCAMAAMLAAWS